MRAVALVLLACASCATLDAPVVNENYQPPTRAQRRARSENAMDQVVHGEDPCADQSADDSRPAIDTVVHTEEGDDAPVPDDGGGCKVWGPGRLQAVTVRGAKAFAPSLVGDGRELASFDRDGTIFRRSLTGSREAGEVRCGKLILAGVAEDRVVARIEPGAVVTTGIMSRRYARAQPCSDRQAAVGAFALMVLAEQNQDRERREADQKKLLDDARLQQEHNDLMRRTRDSAY